MKPHILHPSYNVSASCPNCKTVTSFESKQTVAVAKAHTRANGRKYNRVMYVLSQCAACGLGGFASISDNGNGQDTFLYDFYPFSITLRISLLVFPVTFKPNFVKLNGVRDSA